MSTVITQDRINFQQEQDHLLQVILNERFFKTWEKPCETSFDTPPGNLELYITSTCNQRCEYCYLVKYPDLYPKEYNNKELIMQNLERVYNWIIENNWHLQQIEFYTGEIWHTPWGLEVLELTIEYLKKGLSVSEFLIPTNASFARDRVQREKVCRLANQIDALGSHLTLSFSVDGLILENMERPLVSGEEKTEEFYETLFTLSKEYSWAFHPMLSANSAKYWIENYKWWKRELHKHDLPMHAIMILEVRNDDWGDEELAALEKFIDFLIKDTLTFHDGDCGSAAEDLFLINQCYLREGESFWGDEIPYLPFTLAPCKYYHGCTVATSMTLRLGDLAICPCHRTAYNKNLYGWLTVDEEGKIAGIKANNPQQAVKILMMNNQISTPGCDTCFYRELCLGGCLGMQMETMGDPMRINEKVCRLEKTKYKATLKALKKYGIFDWLDKNISAYHVWYPEWMLIKKLDENIQKEERRERLAKLRADFYS